LKPLKIRLSGYGGQGIVLAGVIVGEAAVLDSKNAVQTQSYGSESRGGACKADVIISDGEIYEIEPTGFDCLVAMSSKAYQKYVSRLKPGGKLIVEEDMITEGSPECEKYSIAATRMADERFGRKIMGNMVMMGFVTALMEWPSEQSMRESIRRNVPEDTQEDNIGAFELGREIGLKATRIADSDQPER
jgi:2-oxoglutarate ferredoxin oxidoreductase subunit gamma